MEVGPKARFWGSFVMANAFAFRFYPKGINSANFSVPPRSGIREILFF
jgi:hypothetical protein